MTTVRWVVDFPQDQLGTGGWIEYPDERTARAHAGTAATVWALVTPDVVDVLTAAREWWATENLPAALLDDQETLLAAVERLTAERDQVACERDGVRAELTRTVDELDDARSTASSYLGTALALRAEVIELRNARKQRDEAIAERDAMRPVVERVRALVNGWREMNPAASLDVGEVVAEVEDALSAAQMPGVDTGTSEPRSAAHGDARPADGAVAAESDPLAESIAAYFGGFVQEEGATYRHNDFAEGLIESLTGAGWNLDAIGHPNTWALPAEPGPEVTAVRGSDGVRWVRAVRNAPGWRRDRGGSITVSWQTMLRDAGSLTDATGETP